MPPIISVHMWVSLPSEVRSRIRTAFSIPRSKSTEVHDGVIMTDGTTPEDFKALTIEKMQAYVADASADFHYLFDRVVAKVTEELTPKPVEPVLITPVVTPPKNAKVKKSK